MGRLEGYERGLLYLVCTGVLVTTACQEITSPPRPTTVVSPPTIQPIPLATPTPELVSGTDSAMIRDWERFKSLYFDIDYPSGWHLDRGRVTLTNSNGQWFNGPPTNGFETAVSLTTIPTPLSLAQLYRTMLQAQILRGVNPKQIIPDPANNSDRKRRVAGEEAYFATIQFRKETLKTPNDYDNVSALLKTPGKLWVITLDTDPSVAQQYLPVYQHMLESFILKSTLLGETQAHFLNFPSYITSIVPV